MVRESCRRRKSFRSRFRPGGVPALERRPDESGRCAKIPRWHFPARLLSSACMTVLEVLTASADFLKRKGIENPRLNAEHLVAGGLGCKRLDLYLRFDERLDEALLDKLRGQVRARGTGVPLQHLLGTVEFLGRTFLCDSRALVPRPETELLVEKTAPRLRALRPDGGLAVDIGTGSGVIAISLALELPGWRVAATDTSPAALELAAENARRLGADIQFARGEFFAGALPDHERADAVVANLPYIPSADIPGLAPEVRHDPVEALDGGADGLEKIRALARLAPSKMAPGGLLALEIGSGQSPAVAALLEAENFQDITVEQDYQKIDRFVFATAP